MITKLGYIGVTSPEASEWEHFAPDVLGAPITGATGGGVRVGMGDREGVIYVHPGADAGVAYLGWESSDSDGLDAVLARVAAAGCTTEEVPRDAVERGVDRLATFVDPNGYRHEIYVGPHRRAKPQSRLNGNPQLGHAFLLVPDASVAENFFVECFGLRLSDRIDFGMGATPFHPGETPVRAVFLSAGDRHHVLAVASVPPGGPDHGLAHLMVEVESLDDVGHAYEQCHKRGCLVTTLGRHVNDEMVSFYLSAPGGVPVELGCGGCPAPSDSHVAARFDAPSSWGHHPIQS